MTMPIKIKAPAKRRPGRPVSTGRGTTVTIYIPRSTYNTLSEIAADNRGTVAAVITSAISAYLGK